MELFNLILVEFDKMRANGEYYNAVISCLSKLTVLLENLLNYDLIFLQIYFIVLTLPKYNGKVFMTFCPHTWFTHVRNCCFGMIYFMLACGLSVNECKGLHPNNFNIYLGKNMRKNT